VSGMGVWDSMKAWFKTEATDLGEAKQELETRLDQDLTRRERQLAETPEESLGRLQEEATDSEASFAAISDKIDQAVARAAAAAEANPPQATDAGPDVDPEFLDRDPS
jgi:phage shock protein A